VQENPILCAIDLADPNKAKALVRELKGAVGGVKLGLEFFAANGPRAVRDTAQGLPLFLDLKLHDIPNTVAGAVSAAAVLEPMFLTVHCAGGRAMMQAAVEAAKRTARKSRMKILGVTVLTSLDERDLDAVGQRGPAGEQVKRLALLAKDSGLDGIICSPHEVVELRPIVGPDFILVVPGIRVGSLGHGDQKRVMGPRDAVQAGADYLVIGRPITGSPSPPAAARAMLAEIRKP
jgi:orotidine-5'-phosphate decarboxylase